MSSTVLVTGASGYIGKFLAKKLTNANYCAIGAVREIGNYSKSHGYQTIRPIGSIDGSTSWESALQGVDYVVHLAGCAHKLGKKPKNLVEQFKTVNTEATANLIEQCVKHGIKRFIFISSIGVLGDDSLAGIITNDSPYNPKNAYSVSKMEAEQAIDVFSGSDLEIITLRPPLVYGPGAPGNFHRLLLLTASFRILPFGMFRGSRSMISLENLCDLIVHCLNTPASSRNKFVVSDNSDWTTEQLISSVSELLGKRIYNIKVPVIVLSVLAKFINRSEDINKLARPLSIDSTESRKLLNWFPKQKPHEGLKEAVKYFQRMRIK